MKESSSIPHRGLAEFLQTEEAARPGVGGGTVPTPAGTLAEQASSLLRPLCVFQCLLSTVTILIVEIIVVAVVLALFHIVPHWSLFPPHIRKKFNQ